MDRHALRNRWREGTIDKTAYAHEMRAMHFDLEEYADFIVDTRIERITIEDGAVTLKSRWADARFHANFDDIGTPVFVALAFGDYEPHEMAVLLDLLGDATGFLDVGANIGWYSVHAAARRPGMRIVALEPVHSTYEELQRNVALNGYAVETFQLALADEAGHAEMQVPDRIAGASSLHLSRPYPGQRTELVEVSTLDALVARLELRLDVVKVDVEGAELSVLRGGVETLRRDRPAVLAEMLRIHAAPFGYHPNDIIAFMAELGYVCCTNTDGAWVRFSSMDESTVETNFLFLHGDRHADRLVAIGPPRS